MESDRVGSTAHGEAADALRSTHFQVPSSGLPGNVVSRLLGSPGDGVLRLPGQPTVEVHGDGRARARGRSRSDGMVILSMSSSSSSSSSSHGVAHLPPLLLLEKYDAVDRLARSAGSRHGTSQMYSYCDDDGRSHPLPCRRHHSVVGTDLSHPRGEGFQISSRECPFSDRNRSSERSVDIDSIMRIADPTGSRRPARNIGSVNPQHCDGSSCPLPVVSR